MLTIKTNMTTGMFFSGHGQVGSAAFGPNGVEEFRATCAANNVLRAYLLDCDGGVVAEYTPETK